MLIWVPTCRRVFRVLVSLLDCRPVHQGEMSESAPGDKVRRGVQCIDEIAQRFVQLQGPQAHLRTENPEILTSEVAQQL